jgi:membrane protein DedA with SNARE-associated domain
MLVETVTDAEEQVNETIVSERGCREKQPSPELQASTREETHIDRLRRIASRYWRPALGFLVAALVSVSVLAISDRVESFERYGYGGVFLISLLASATIILPAPSLAIVSVMGSVLNPFLVGLAAGAGEALGELTGYLAGYSGRAVVGDHEQYAKIETWTRKYGLWVIFVLSVVPNPLFDLAGIAAGALKLPVGKFLLVCWAGKSIKTTLFALGGYAVILSLLGR